jgi:hypothetical protein
VRIPLWPPGLIAAALAVTIAGCSSAAPSRSPEIALSSPGASAATVLTSALPAASATASQSPSPSTVAVARWSKALRVGAVAECGPPVAGIDAGGSQHIAASCDGHLRYAVSTGDGNWTTTDIPAPKDRLELDPKIAFQGTTMYLAYTRVAPDQGCGGTYADVGVYYRRRTLPNGAWSAPTQFGIAKDALQGFRVDGSTLHAVVQGTDGTDYLRIDGSTVQRYTIQAYGASLRVGSDGRARLVTRLGDSLRFGVFNGSGFSTSPIVGTRYDDWAFLLVLDAKDGAHLLWTRSPGTGGCASLDATPEDGTYYATNASGTWESGRFTTQIGPSALQYDDATGTVHILVGTVGLVYYTKSTTGSWNKTSLASTATSAAALARDPANGTLLAVWVRSTGESAGIYVVTKG